MSELLPEVERERSHYSRELEERDPVFGRVAFWITLTALLAAGAGYAERLAASHQAAADRHARAKAVEAVGAAIAADVADRERVTLNAAVSQARLSRDEYGFVGDGQYGSVRSPEYEKAVQSAYSTAADRLDKLATGFFGRRYAVHGRFDAIAFTEDQQFPRFAAAEWQKAYAAERASWASKRGELVFAISVFAVALFLLGLTLTVPAGSRYLFFGAGLIFMVGASAFTLYAWLRHTATPSGRAIAAYARAQAADKAAAPYSEVVAAASAAIEHDRDYGAAYGLRGNAHLGLAFAALSGPVDEVGAIGTARGEASAARDDLRRATRLAPANYSAWVDLSEALYLLADYRGALAANARARGVEAARPVGNLDRIVFLLATGRRWRAKDPDDAVATEFQRTTLTSLEHVPLSARTSALSGAERLVNLTLHRRPKAIPKAVFPDFGSFQRRLDQLDAIVNTFPPSYANAGTAVAPHTSTSVDVRGLRFPGDLSELTETFDYSGAKRSDRRVYLMFVNGSHVLTDGPIAWSDPRFGFPYGPDKVGSIAHTFSMSRNFQPGDRVRTMLYVQGNLRAICRFKVAPGDVDVSKACAKVGGAGTPSAQGQTA